ncbi:chemotaxis protein CheC, inhibitor of MCP methylation [Methanomethylovorans hollandica DSM 15978]|uniref:Chemotaxis protein CheC, inhibitor of MCP methylation n=1 Tax=Methanomethylovorans hollandica (strain DSM 15978 / NBRC 107637 / DMS1) TaxID=867904 RepID=L0KWY5_METHD|nr:chemotaxis protein CheC [Methanomethylovorans hollandica]AGB49641.1 chemotaxis protein CheC, inhibitor of MCP methylation [Methanomethylovorans hollandica DSM 15978]
MVYDISKLTDFHYSALKEISNIGIGNAVTSLAEMMGSEIKIMTPSLKVARIEKVTEFSGGADKLVSGVLMELAGGVNGYMVILLPPESAQLICNTMTKKEYSDITDPMNESLISEVGHILGSTYITAFSDFLKVDVFASAPFHTYDMIGAIMDNILIHMSQEVEHAIILDTLFTLKGNDMHGKLLTLFDPISLELILKHVDAMFC